MVYVVVRCREAEKPFLQGSQDDTERDGPIYMQSPRDDILNAAQAYPASLYEITGNCYGLSNATSHLVQEG